MGERTVTANGFSFHVLEEGSGDRLALCLHGFPELGYSWRHQLPVLADLGYRAVLIGEAFVTSPDPYKSLAGMADAGKRR